MVVVACPDSSLVDVHIDPDRTPSSFNHDYASAYSRIRSAARTAGTGVSSVLILSSPDVDSVCATRILTWLFLQDDIPHRIVPVEGYRSLLNTLSTVFPPLSQHEDQEGARPTNVASSSTSADVRSVILINLGAVLGLPTTFDIPPSCTIHVIDSHRPWNLENLFATSHANDRVWCWDDGEIASKLCRQGGERDAFEKLEFDLDSVSEHDSDDASNSSSSSSSGSDNEGEQGEAEAEAEGGKRKRSRSSKSPSTSKRRNRNNSSQLPTSSATRLSNAERHRYRTVLTRYYNRGESFGMSVSSMLYLLCESLGRADRESLWLAIVGLTSLYLSNSIDLETYETYSAAYASEVIAIEPNSASAPHEAWSLDLLGKETAEETGVGVGPGRKADRALRKGISQNTKSEDADDRSIRIIPSELRFTLYRHWSLETAMYHTAYVAAKLGIWRERGLSKLRGLMAKMGFSLSAVRQNYTHMPLDLRRSLVRKLEGIAPEYGLTELTYRGFERSFGFRTAPLGAGDIVEGLSALLVAAHGVKIEVETPGMVFASASSGAGRGGGPLGNSFAANLNPANPNAQTSELFATKRVWNLGTNLTDAVNSAIAATAPGSGKEQTGANAGLDLDSVASQANASAQDVARLEQAEREVWVTNFYEAYRALDTCRSTSVDLLRSSLLLSQALHRKIVARGISLITNQSIRTLKNFRLAILKDGSDLQLFTHVEILSRLANWLTTSLRDILVEQQTLGAQRKKNSTKANAAAYAPLPFILAALHPGKDSFLVLGSTASAVHGMVENNHFTAAFQSAAKMSGARVRHDRFQTFSILVRKSDLAGFVEKVHLKIK
ncbi:probable TSD2 protein, required for DNA replication [Ustilago bromivora]|uniref:Probable TSD2 protein, required for DNA replication n=1 Tax=Ustilago bromivora TaxID=307758 RepID=A0A1K0GB76_9BASI|nr:probable TSD2 protein, required for DNA replication [Ustilago bromivora]SYW76635.1 probable TSD2 protein, required for DNA replication [Ustilago bromivora]